MISLHVIPKLVSFRDCVKLSLHLQGSYLAPEANLKLIERYERFSETNCSKFKKTSEKEQILKHI